MQRRGLEFSVIVVDNDLAESARPVVTEFSSALPNATYAVEPMRGIAAVRNRLVQLSKDRSVDYIAFVDDDEWVESDWLVNLVHTAESYQADVVKGPVLRQFETGSPDWAGQANIFAAYRQRTGSLSRSMAAGNLLVRMNRLLEFEGPFNVQFNLSGGEDTHLQERMRASGTKIVWCDEAVAHEYNTKDRATIAWVVKRGYRVGAVMARSTKMIHPTPSKLLSRLAKDMAHLGIGLLFLVISPIRVTAKVVDALSQCARGVGGMAGLLGHSYEEYQEVHGQ